MKLRCVRKLVFQRIGCYNLGRNGGLWCWEFQRKWELGSVGKMEELRGDSGMDLAME